jgi:hypothetical protein
MSTGIDLSTFPFPAQGAPEALIRQHLLLGRFTLHGASANYARDTEIKAYCRRGGQEASRLDDRLDRARLVRAREALKLVTGSTDFIEPISGASCPTAIVLSCPPKEKGTASPRPDTTPQPDTTLDTTCYPSSLDSDAWTAQILRAQDWDIDTTWTFDHCSI